MDGFEIQAARGYRLDDPADPAGVSCDAEGPKVGPVRLLIRTSFGFAPRSAEELDFVLAASGYPMSFSDRMASLTAIASALNNGDLAGAMFKTQFMRLPLITEEKVLRRIIATEDLCKGDWDESKHPRWPAGSAEGRPGQFRPGEFRPKNALVPAGEATDQSLAQRAARLAARRAMRSRYLELLGDSEHDPVDHAAHALKDSLLLDDLSQMAVDVQDLKAASDAVRDFLAGAPYSLEDLQVSNEAESFSSYDAFYKVLGFDDLILLKRFGPAGLGYQYHHNVEQEINDGTVSPELLQSTSNIIRLPTLLHEEISATYSTKSFAGELTVRQWLKGQSFEDQYAYGLQTLRKMGILK